MARSGGGGMQSNNRVHYVRRLIRIPRLKGIFFFLDAIIKRPQLFFVVLARAIKYDSIN